MAARDVLAAKQVTLQLDNEHGASFRLQRPQVLAQLLDGLPLARHNTPNAWTVLPLL